MAFKFVIVSCLVALVRAGNIPAAVVVEPAPLARLEEFNDVLPNYIFGYNVFDTITGDVKSQTEQRSGDLVQGEYSLNEADGTRRVVTYTADDKNGFNAVVRNLPQLVEPAVVAEPAAGVVEPAVVEQAVVPARIAAAPVVPATRFVSAPAPAPLFASRYTGAFPAPLARYAFPQFQPFARFTAAAPFAYPGTAAQVVAA